MNTNSSTTQAKSKKISDCDIEFANRLLAYNNITEHDIIYSTLKMFISVELLFTFSHITTTNLNVTFGILCDGSTKSIALL